jgi:hypothetical protein
MVHSKAFCLTCGGLLADTGPSFILVHGTSGEDCHVCVREGVQPLDSLKNPDSVLNLGRFEVIAVYAAAWDPTFWVTPKTLVLFQILYHKPLLCKFLLCSTSTINSRLRGVRAPHLVFNWSQKFMLLLSHSCGSCNKIRVRMHVIKGQK